MTDGVEHGFDIVVAIGSCVADVKSDIYFSVG